jgi:methionyl-tRNA synthetase
MLQAAELPLPERVWAHGFISFSGERFSKSAGVKISLPDAIGRFGPDAFRYFLLREVPFDGDGSFSAERFEAVYTSELANGIGNLASRTIAMIEKYCAAVVPRSAAAPDGEQEDLADLAAARSSMDGSRGYLPHEALGRLQALTQRANLYIQRSQPWTLAKDAAQSAALHDVLAALTRSIARQAVYLAPFMPEKAEELWRQIGGAEGMGRKAQQVLYSEVEQLDVTGWRVTKGGALFPKET